jgi:bifunctional non-homologous end joining protein LigD
MSRINDYTGPKEQIKQDQLYKYENQNWIATEKVDGAWACVDTEMNGGFGKFTSRTGHQFDINSFADVTPFQNCTLIGELEIASQASTKSYTRLGYRRFWIFDATKIIGHDIKSLPYVKRRHLIETLYKESDKIKLVEQKENNFSEFYEEVLARGGEGLVLKKAQSTYGFGKTNDWVRVKPKNTIDFYVMGLGKTPSGNDNLQLGLYVNGKLERIQSLTMPSGWVGGQLVGKVIECEGMELMDSGALRSAQFVRVREDKTKEMCEG